MRRTQCKSGVEVSVVPGRTGRYYIDVKMKATVFKCSEGKKGRKGRGLMVNIEGEGHELGEDLRPGNRTCWVGWVCRRGHRQ